MKTLLTLIAISICLSGGAQHIQVDTVKWSAEYDVSVGFGWDTTIPIVEWGDNLDSRLAKLLGEYLEECYNDSSMMLQEYSVTRFGTWNVYFGHAPVPPDTVYTHREPTLGGFYEYLIKRK